MAVKDVKIYVNQLLTQYLEMKNDLADFEQAFKNGYITEDKLVEIKDTVDRIETNYQRVLYIAYLLELLNNKKKKLKAKKQNKKLEDYFSSINATSEDVIDENKSLLDNLRKNLEKLVNKKS